ncbi:MULTISPECIES: hypothetical protein [Erwiniaceae]|uniref:hypothetical protein n=1 Tax=Erwiniaceae TaxID=1903409 RepID=UPI001B30AFCD|nr:MULTISPECIES: hypothetical protein [Erwiniaceae]MCX0501062.1 hypothetical protein [Erwinia billingiae]MDI3366378.1 hypothetical protein [Pantoea sp. V108_6]
MIVNINKEIKISWCFQGIVKEIKKVELRAPSGRLSARVILTVTSDFREDQNFIYYETDDVKDYLNKEVIFIASKSDLLDMNEILIFL